jgi:hypothetical protein
MLPGGWTDQMETEPVYGTVTYEGEPESTQITYNFTGFQKVKLEDMQIEELFEGEVDDTLDAFDEETPTSELEVMLQDLGARKTTRGNLQIDGQYYYLEYSKWAVMQKGNTEELFIIPSQEDEKYVGSRQRVQTDFTSEFMGEEPTETPIVSKNISVASIPQNLVSGVEAFGTKQEATPEIKKILGPSPHSIDMIEAGLRTRTTRSVGEMDKYKVKVGDIVTQFGKSADGTTKQILTKVTAIHPKGTAGFLGTWNKEGWTQKGIDAIKRYKEGAAAVEFEIVKAPNKFPVDGLTQEKIDQVKEDKKNCKL